MSDLSAKLSEMGLEEVHEEIHGCPLCILSESRNKAVPGAGPNDADIMFIGEAPGFHEDQQGLPFVGAAGSFLDELLESIGLDRKEVYITNIVKCRPPGNRDPKAGEIEACAPYLERQIDLIQPRMIVTLGRFAMEHFISEEKISRVHGKPRKMGGIIYYPLFHPAAALHQPRYREPIEEDFAKIPELLKQFDEIEDVGPEEDAEQLSLF